VSDQLTSRRRLAVGHWWTAYPIPVLYAVLNISYWAAGGQNEVRKDIDISDQNDSRDNNDDLVKLP